MSKFTLDNAGNYGETRSVNNINPEEHGNVRLETDGAVEIKHA